MPAKILMVASAAILLMLGFVHLYYTFQSPLLTPRDPALESAMTQISPVISSQTTMWRCWLGFNATHSIALLLFGVIFGYLAVAQAPILFNSPFLLAVGLATLTGFAIVCKLYFFSSPLAGIAIAWLCYLASMIVSRLRL